MNQKSKRVKYFSALEVANICGVVNQTVINWIKAGYLKAYMTPGGQFRVSPEDLEEFLCSRGVDLPPELSSVLKPSTATRGKSLIIVDDDKVLNSLIKKYIEKNFPSIKVFQAFDGFEAGSLMAKEKPGLVLLDLDLPGVDGFSLCKKIKRDVMFKNPFIVVITALKDVDLAEKVSDLGSNYFLTKPLNMEQVGAIVNQWVGMATDKANDES